MSKVDKLNKLLEKAPQIKMGGFGKEIDTKRIRSLVSGHISKLFTDLNKHGVSLDVKKAANEIMKIIK